MYGDELITLLVDAGVATYGTDLFLGRRATVPSGDGPYTQVIVTGGAAPERTHDEEGARPAYERPTAQITTRAKSYTDAMTRARACYDVLVAVHNRSVGSATVFYRQIDPLQPPFEEDPDQNGRAMVTFNVIATKRPS